MSDRTPEERERARLEREARRAAREGRPPPEPAAPSEPAAPRRDEPPAARSERPVPRSEPPAARSEPPARRSERPVSRSESPAARSEPPARRSESPAARSEPTAPRSEPTPPVPEHDDDHDEVPLQPVRRLRKLGASGSARGADAVRAARAAAAARAGRSASKGAGSGPPAEPRGPLRRILLGAGVLVGLVFAWFLFSLFQPFDGGEGEGSVKVTIPTGSSVGEIADLLAEKDVISGATFFEIRATIGGDRGELKPGSYELRRDMSYGAAIEALKTGPPDDTVQVVIPEGLSRREISEVVEKSGLEGSYLRATESSRRINLRRYGAARAQNLEGFLFPATYELERGDSVRELVADQLEAFKREFSDVSLRRAKSKNLTAYDVLIIASMVEREAMLDKERPLVASVIYNRLSRGEPLGIDATIRFATNNWQKPLTESDLAIESPYNTRRRAGLPPTPIGNPGIASIRAAARPADTNFLFYVVKPGTCGEHDFSETLEEFERDAARYNRERERRGGQSPTNCP